MEPSQTKSEEDLLRLIFGDIQDIRSACYQKMREFNNNKIKSSIIKIISLAYSSGKLEFGNYLSNYKSDIINHLYECYNNEQNYTNFILYLSQIDHYNAIIKFFREVEVYKNDYAYDFFKIHLKEDLIIDIINKYFFKKLNLTLPFYVKIKDINELIKIINDSNSLSNEKCHFHILYYYILKKDDLKRNKMKNSNNINNNQNNNLNNINSTIISETDQKINSSNVIQQNPDIINISLNNYPNKLNDKESIKEPLNISNNNDKNYIKIQEISEKIDTNIIKDYFQSRKEYYSKKGYETPFLDELLEEKIKINKDIFLFKKPQQEYFIEPHYINLKYLINIFSNPEMFQKFVVKEKKYGYICYKAKKSKKYVLKEGIFGILQNTSLYKEITNKKKFEKDNFGQEDKTIVDNAFKERGLALKYYINGIFMELLDQDELPRMAYNLDSKKLKKLVDEEKKIQEEIEEETDEEIEEEIKDEMEEEIEEEMEEEIEDENKEKISEENKEKIKEEIKEKIKKDREIEELDGVFYTKKDYEIKIDELPFIIDNMAEIDNLVSPNFKFYAECDNKIKIDKNTLIFIEVKNKFPETYDFNYQVRKICNKTVSFSQLYGERYENITKIKIMFFYNAVPKKSYESKVLPILENIFGNNKIKNKIQFQFIFITSSYLAYNFKNMKDRIDILENSSNDHKSKIEDLQKDNNAFKSEVEELKNDNRSLKKRIEFLESKLDKILKVIVTEPDNHDNQSETEEINSLIQDDNNLQNENENLNNKNQKFRKKK